MIDRDNEGLTLDEIDRIAFGIEKAGLAGLDEFGYSQAQTSCEQRAAFKYLWPNRRALLHMARENAGLRVEIEEHVADIKRRDDEAFERTMRDSLIAPLMKRLERKSEQIAALTAENARLRAQAASEIVSEPDDREIELIEPIEPIEPPEAGP